MITIVAKNTIKPGMAEDFKRMVKPLIMASQQESGCIAYDLYEDIADPNILTFIEQWEDQTAIETHNNSPHFTQIVPKIGVFCEGSEVRLYKMVRDSGKGDE